MTKAVKPKIIGFDIENSHTISRHFNFYDTSINYDDIVQHSFIICACWKVLGESKIHSVSVLDDAKRFKKDHRDEYHVIKTMHEVLSDADMLYGHNSKKFDLPKLNASFIRHGLTPLPKIPHVDTLGLARSQFKFPSNRLDSLGDFLGVGRKVHTPKGLWYGAADGVEKDIKTMVKYCKGDVQLLEDVFNKLKPFARVFPKLSDLVVGGVECSCPKCGSQDLQQRGWAVPKSRNIKRVQCTNCGSWSQVSVTGKLKNY